jgi:hypothetical protein
VSATIYGVLGLAHAYELQPAQYRNKILDEIKWGNQYFLKMQEPQGFEMDFVGGDLLKHSDNNRWTDNVVNQKGTGIELVTPNAGSSKQLMLTSKEHDDRVIQTQPVEMMAQYNFIAAEAMVARITSGTDPVYSKKCLDAAKKCYEYCLKHDKDTATGNAGAALQASIELYRATKNPLYKKRATEIAKALHELQVNNNDGVSGFYKVSFTNDQPYKNIWNGCQAFIGLSDLVKLFPTDKDAAAWKDAIRNYANKYLLQLSSMNSFGIVPWGLYTDKDPGGNRKIGNYWYRYFMQPEDEWWVGVNANIASAGVGLLKASEILKDPKMKAVAQKQLDWIFGSNPHSSSTMVGTGYNHPKHFAGSSFIPTVPLIDGAVINGIGGTHEDMPVIGDGDWQISEYWTPMVAYTLWLMAEISAH